MPSYEQLQAKLDVEGLWLAMTFYEVAESLVSSLTVGE
jgi:hypothetical protein